MAFARFCTEPYTKPNRHNMDNLYMHLTNYAINKYAEGYEDGDEGAEGCGHKRSLGAIL
jgi:tubulin polyglutamylase TTLL6/13